MLLVASQPLVSASRGTRSTCASIAEFRHRLIQVKSRRGLDDSSVAATDPVSDSGVVVVFTGLCEGRE